MVCNNKLHIEIFILIFMFTVISLCILFSFYYISPNNYVLFDYNSNEKYISTKEYTVQSNEQLKIEYEKYKNNKIRIYNDTVELIAIVLENKFKSDNIYIGKNKLIKLINSDLIIKNTTSNSIKIQIETYL